MVTENPKRFVVQCGTVFESVYPNRPLAIVTTLHETYVNAQGIEDVDEGKETIVFGGGSTDYRDIKRVIERWDKCRMASAIKLGLEREFGQRSFVASFIQSALKKLDEQYEKSPIELAQNISK